MAELPRLNGIIKALEEGSVAFVGSAPADGAAGTSAPYDGALFEMEHGPYDIRALQEGLLSMLDRRQIAQRGIAVLPDAYLNSGGVAVSYLEWIKNLSHIHFGAMERRLEEIRGHELVRLVEAAVGRDLPESLTRKIMTGADEIDRVRSGLQDTMSVAYARIRERRLVTDEIDDLRTAAYVVALEKIVRFYRETGGY